MQQSHSLGWGDGGIFISMFCDFDFVTFNLACFDLRGIFVFCSVALKGRLDVMLRCHPKFIGICEVGHGDVVV